MTFPTAVVRAGALVAAAGALLSGAVARGQSSSADALVKALQQGGHIILLRHASSPREAPDSQTANADNVKRERQLDEAGRAGAAAMGRALVALKIPVGDVLTSPTYRAMETVRLARLPNSQPFAELGDGGQSMQGVADAQGAWLREKTTRAPAGTNTVIVTHLPNIARAFPERGSDVAEGEALIFRPDGRGGTTLMGRVKVDEWRRLVQP